MVLEKPSQPQQQQQLQTHEKKFGGIVQAWFIMSSKVSKIYAYQKKKESISMLHALQHYINQGLIKLELQH